MLQPIPSYLDRHPILQRTWLDSCEWIKKHLLLNIILGIAGIPVSLYFGATDKLIGWNTLVAAIVFYGVGIVLVLIVHFFLAPSKLLMEKDIQIQDLGDEVAFYKDQLAPTLKLSEPFLEHGYYEHFSLPGQVTYYRIARITVENTGNVTVYNVKLTIKDFSRGGTSYNGMVFIPKDDVAPFHDRIFTLNKGDSKIIDIALRRDGIHERERPSTYLQLISPKYVSTNIGDNELLGLRIQVTANDCQNVETRVDLYLEKQQSTNQNGEVTFHKILNVRPSIVDESAPTEIHMYKEREIPA